MAQEIGDQGRIPSGQGPGHGAGQPMGRPGQATASPEESDFGPRRPTLAFLRGGARAI